MGRLERVRRQRKLETAFRFIGVVVVTVILLGMAWYIVNEGIDSNNKYNAQVMCTTHGAGSSECATAEARVK